VIAFFDAELQHAWEFITCVGPANNSTVSSASPLTVSKEGANSEQHRQTYSESKVCEDRTAMPHSLVLAVLLAKEVNEWGHLLLALTARTVELGWNLADLASASPLPCILASLHPCILASLHIDHSAPIVSKLQSWLARCLHEPGQMPGDLLFVLTVLLKESS
jgi:hypothetical protein